jgi:ABC-2 type transport system ATP-binding protein
MTVEGVTQGQLEAFGHELPFIQSLGNRVLLRTSDAASQQMLRQVMQAGGRVTQLSPSRFSLEDLFLKALEEAKQGTVGGEIS